MNRPMTVCEIRVMLTWYKYAKQVVNWYSIKMGIWYTQKYNMRNWCSTKMGNWCTKNGTRQWNCANPKIPRSDPQFPRPRKRLWRWWPLLRIHVPGVLLHHFWLKHYIIIQNIPKWRFLRNKVDKWQNHYVIWSMCSATQYILPNTGGEEYTWSPNRRHLEVSYSHPRHGFRGCFARPQESTAAKLNHGILYVGTVIDHKGGETYSIYRKRVIISHCYTFKY